jgi:hypothetical protein
MKLFTLAFDSIKPFVWMPMSYDSTIVT